MQTKKGQSIEDASMQMIEDEIGSHEFNEKEWPIVRRIIHSTADFDFADKNKLIFHKDAIESGMKALKNGCSIVVDVNGVIGGMNKQNPKDFGNNVICNISKPEIMELAKKEDKTQLPSIFGIIFFTFFRSLQKYQAVVAISNATSTNVYCMNLLIHLQCNLMIFVH